MAWYSEKAITNVLSLNNVKRKYRITYDSENGDVFYVHHNNKLLEFH